MGQNFPTKFSYRMRFKIPLLQTGKKNLLWPNTNQLMMYQSFQNYNIMYVQKKIINTNHEVIRVLAALKLSLILLNYRRCSQIYPIVSFIHSTVYYYRKMGQCGPTLPILWVSKVRIEMHVLLFSLY